MTESALRAIGIRVSPNAVYYAIIEEGEPFVLLTASSVVVPAALRLPEQLHFIRTTLLDIMAEYEVRRAGIRLTEPNAQSTSVERLNLEGVVQELLSSSEVESYFAGAIATIAARLGEVDRSRIKGYFEGEPFFSFDRWAELDREERESIVTAVAATHLTNADV